MQNFGGNPLGKRLDGRPRKRWEDGDEMDLNRVACEHWSWMKLLQGLVQLQA
jgi:hypothetical protein